MEKRKLKAKKKLVELEKEECEKLKQQLREMTDELSQMNEVKTRLEVNFSNFRNFVKKCSEILTFDLESD